VRFLPVLAAALAAPLCAHDVISTKVTWSNEISRLVRHRCASCHNGRTAFGMSDYAAARPWAKAIKEETGSRRMPPGQAVPGFGDLEDDGALTQEQIELISDWVEGGAPEGDPGLLPEKSVAASGAKTKPKRVPRIGGPGLEVAGGTRLTRRLLVTAVRPDGFHAGAGGQVVARLPDGNIVPLLWIYAFNPRYARTFFYRTPVLLPAGTEIQIAPAGAGSLTLFP